MVPMLSEVKKETAPGSVQSTGGTLWMSSSYHTGVHGHRAATLSPARHKLHSTAFASCTLPGIDTKHLHLKHYLQKHEYSSASSNLKAKTSLVCAADCKMKHFELFKCFLACEKSYLFYSL